MFLECCTPLKMPVLFTVNDFAIRQWLHSIHAVITNNNFCGKTVASAKGANVALCLRPRAAAPEDGCKQSPDCDVCMRDHEQTHIQPFMAFTAEDKTFVSVSPTVSGFSSSRNELGSVCSARSCAQTLLSSSTTCLCAARHARFAPGAVVPRTV